MDAIRNELYDMHNRWSANDWMTLYAGIGVFVLTCVLIWAVIYWLGVVAPRIDQRKNIKHIYGVDINKMSDADRYVAISTYQKQIHGIDLDQINMSRQQLQSLSSQEPPSKT